MFSRQTDLLHHLREYQVCREGAALVEGCQAEAVPCSRVGELLGDPAGVHLCLESLTDPWVIGGSVVGGTHQVEQEPLGSEH